MSRLFLFVIVFWGVSVYARGMSGSGLRERLYSVPGVKSVEECRDSACGTYYRCFIEQPRDHEHPERGTFLQQFRVLHHSDSAAVVFVTEGGQLDSLYWSEAAMLLNANQVIIETRYCGASVPDGNIDWNTMTMQQVAADIHAIIAGMKQTLYAGNYLVQTGKERGGQESLFHRRYYPEDVHQVILYNTPLCVNASDKRIARYQMDLGKSGKLFGGGGGRFGTGSATFSFFPTVSELNLDIKDFQLLCLNHQDSLLVLFEKYSRERGLTFSRVGTPARALQLTILEYRPAFFGKVVSRELIPYLDLENLRACFEHLVEVSDPAFFSDASVTARQAVSWLALNETGNYKYYTQPFRKVLFKDIQDRSYLYVADMRADEAVFRRKQVKEMVKWVQHEAKDILFVYGLLDVYSAAKVNVKKNNSCTRLVSPVQGRNCRFSGFEWGTYLYLQDFIVSGYREFKRQLP